MGMRRKLTDRDIAIRKTYYSKWNILGFISKEKIYSNTYGDHCFLLRDKKTGKFNVDWPVLFCGDKENTSNVITKIPTNLHYENYYPLSHIFSGVSYKNLFRLTYDVE